MKTSNRNISMTRQFTTRKKFLNFRFSLLRPINDLTMGVFDTQRLACKQYLETFYLMESKPFINDYNLKNVPLSLTSDKRMYQLLPTILTEICDPLSGVVTKSKKKKILKRMRGLLGKTNHNNTEKSFI